MFRHCHLQPLADRGPLRVMFVITSMPVGGMESLLVELIRRVDRAQILPELCCLKQLDRLGLVMADEIPVHTGLLSGKYDLRVLPRLVKLLKQRRIDAVVTVGTGGDKMFWGRLAARLAGVPVICSALHSTGLPDRVEFLNRRLAPITDAFIGVADSHGRYLAEHEGCPARKVRVIPNGVDTDKFRPRRPNPELKQQLNLSPEAPVAGIVAALRPEKNHELFLRAAARVVAQMPQARFLIVGDGPEHPRLEALAKELKLVDAVRFLGTRGDIVELLSLMDVFALTSHMEARPVSIIEAMACEKPVVATHVGSISETVVDGKTGYLVPPGDEKALADRILQLFSDRDHATTLGHTGREEVILHGSIARMVTGYEQLITGIYAAKSERFVYRAPSPEKPQTVHRQETANE